VALVWGGVYVNEKNNQQNICKGINYDVQAQNIQLNNIL
jgi:hypothetical protein